MDSCGCGPSSEMIIDPVVPTEKRDSPPRHPINRRGVTISRSSSKNSQNGREDPQIEHYNGVELAPPTTPRRFSRAPVQKVANSNGSDLKSVGSTSNSVNSKQSSNKRHRNHQHNSTNAYSGQLPPGLSVEEDPEFEPSH